MVTISTHSLWNSLPALGNSLTPFIGGEVLCFRKRFSWGIVPGISGALTWIRCWHSPGEMCIKTPSFDKFVLKLNLLLPQGRRGEGRVVRVLQVSWLYATWQPMQLQEPTLPESGTRVIHPDIAVRNRMTYIQIWSPGVKLQTTQWRTFWNSR